MQKRKLEGRGGNGAPGAYRARKTAPEQSGSLQRTKRQPSFLLRDKTPHSLQAIQKKRGTMSYRIKHRSRDDTVDALQQQQQQRIVIGNRLVGRTLTVYLYGSNGRRLDTVHVPHNTWHESTHHHYHHRNDQRHGPFSDSGIIVAVAVYATAGATWDANAAGIERLHAAPLVALFESSALLQSVQIAHRLVIEEHEIKCETVVDTDHRWVCPPESRSVRRVFRRDGSVDTVLDSSSSSDEDDDADYHDGDRASKRKRRCMQGRRFAYAPNGSVRRCGISPDSRIGSEWLPTDDGCVAHEQTWVLSSRCSTTSLGHAQQGHRVNHVGRVGIA